MVGGRVNKTEVTAKTRLDQYEKVQGGMKSLLELGSGFLLSPVTMML
jgi:hypothetical protein